jgi:hypothetical protein
MHEERERIEEPVMVFSKSLQSTWPSHMESKRLTPHSLKIMYSTKKLNSKASILSKKGRERIG